MEKITTTTGEKIRIARTKAGLSQGELANRLDVTRSLIGQYERGVRNPKPSTIQRIADALGIPFTELIPVDAIKQLPPAQPEPCEDAVSRAEILRMINCINDHHAITPYKSVGAVTEHLTRIASNLPPVTPKQRTGKWIPVDSYSAFGGDEATWMAHGNPVAFYYCSECKEHAYAGEDGDDILSNFCPNCGAKMEGDAE